MDFISRIPIYRMSRIRQKLLRYEQFNARTLAKEFEVTTKTVHRDIAFMREFLGYEINYVEELKSFVGRPSLITTL